MYLPGGFAIALILTILSAVFWGSWANTYKGTRNYPFELFYWDYIVGVVACSFIFALTLGSHGGTGESFVQNIRNADRVNFIHALLAGAIFNAANLLLIAAVAIAGLAVAFPIAIGIAVVEGVVLSYALQRKGNATSLAIGVLLAIAAVLLNSKAYQALSRKIIVFGNSRNSRTGVLVSVISGVLMGGLAPFITRAMTHGNALTPYSVAALFSVGALLCCLVVNVYFMRHPIQGTPVSFAGYPRAGARNHLLGFLGGLLWGTGGCLNFISAGFVGVPISYAIGQSAPLIAAAWGVLVWREFTGAPASAWIYLGGMFLCYLAAISLIAFAYEG